LFRKGLWEGGGLRENEEEESGGFGITLKIFGKF
jgi:hypothetical protein